MSLVDTFVNLPEGAVFSLEYVNELKKKLENLEGEELLIVENSKQLSIRCSNDPIGICPFAYRFDKKKDVQSNEIGLEFKSRFILHSPSCKVNNQQACFERNSDLIQKNRQFIANVMVSRYHLYGPQTPTKILLVVSKELDFNGPFIYQGLVDGDLKRKMKKKFDNIISQIRLKLNIPVSCPPNKQSKKRQKKKIRLSFKPFINFEADQEKAIDEFFMSEESDDEASDFQPKISKESPIKNSRSLRKTRIPMKDEQNSQENSFQYTENDPNTAQSHETFAGKTKLINKQ